MTNDMKEIEKLYAKPKTYKIPKKKKEGEDQITVEIFAVSLDDMGCLNMDKDMPVSEMAKNATTLFSKSLKITEKEAGQISFTHMMDLMDAVMDCNDFDEKDLKGAGIQKFIADKQAQTEAKKLEEKKVKDDKPNPAT